MSSKIRGYFRPSSNVRAFLLGTAFLVALLLNFLIVPRWDPLFFKDAEFTPALQLERDRGSYMMEKFLPALFLETFTSNEIFGLQNEERAYELLRKYGGISKLKISNETPPLFVTDEQIATLVSGNRLREAIEGISFLASFESSTEQAPVFAVKSTGGHLYLTEQRTLEEAGLFPDD